MNYWWKILHLQHYSIAHDTTCHKWNIQLLRFFFLHVFFSSLSGGTPSLAAIKRPLKYKIFCIMSENRAFWKCYGENFTIVNLLYQYFVYSHIYTSTFLFFSILLFYIILLSVHRTYAQVNVFTSVEACIKRYMYTYIWFMINKKKKSHTLSPAIIHIN